MFRGIKGGQAIPLGKGFYYMRGRKHSQGGIDVSKNLEVEDKEVVQITPKHIKVYSAQPILNGISPAKAVLGGANPNKVFNAQENYKDRNGLNDDGSKKARLGIDWERYKDDFNYRSEIIKSLSKQQNTNRTKTTTNSPIFTDNDKRIAASEQGKIDRVNKQIADKARIDNGLKEGVKTIAENLPVIGDALTVNDAIIDFKNGNNLAGAIGLSSLVLPFGINKVIKRFMPKITKYLVKQSDNLLDWDNWSKGGKISTEHIKEYNEIEKKARANGTWLKNSDGSDFIGDPRSWVQMQSKDFKKSFGENPEILYSGISENINPEFNNIQWLTNRENRARTYATNDDNVLQIVTNSKPSYTINAEGRNWRGIAVDETGEIGTTVVKDKTLINTNDIARTKFKNNESIRINNVNDAGPRIPNKNSKYYGILDPIEELYTPADDIVLGKGTTRKSILFNNGDFNVNDKNIFKAMLPVAGLSSFYYLNNKKRLGGKSKLGTKEEYFNINLPNVTVTPEPWQIDFHKNFGNRFVRKKVIDELKEEYINYPKNLASDELDDALYNAKNNNDKRAIISKFNNDNFIKAQNESNMRQENIDNIDTNQFVKRIYNVWNEAGRPSITNNKSIVNYISDPYRANYSPIFNKIYRAITLRDVIAELAHPIQDKKGNKKGFLKYITQFPKAIIGEITGDRSHYDDNNHYEGETHNIIEPELYDYIIENKPTKYINKKAMGGITNRVPFTGGRTQSKRKARLGTDETLSEAIRKAREFNPSFDGTPIYPYGVLTDESTENSNNTIYTNSGVDGNSLANELAKDYYTFGYNVPFSGIRVPSIFDRDLGAFERQRANRAAVQNKSNSTEKPFIQTNYKDWNGIYRDKRVAFTNGVRPPFNKNIDITFIEDDRPFTVNTNFGNYGYGMLDYNTVVYPTPSLTMFSRPMDYKSIATPEVTSYTTVNSTKDNTTIPAKTTDSNQSPVKESSVSQTTVRPTSASVKPTKPTRRSTSPVTTTKSYVDRSVNDFRLPSGPDVGKATKITTKDISPVAKPKAETFTEDIKRRTINNLNVIQNTKSNFFKDNSSSLIGAASDLLSTGFSYISNKRAINNMSAPKTPVITPVRRLETNYNINPQVDNIRETTNTLANEIANNSSSSASVLNRINKLRLSGLMQKNQLYGQKENAETQLINQDALNQQQVAATNVAAYNQYQDRLTDYNNKIADLKGENNIGLISGINSVVQNTLKNKKLEEQFIANLVATGLPYKDVVNFVTKRIPLPEKYKLQMQE